MYTNLYNRRGNTSLVAKIFQVKTKVFQSTRTNCLNIPHICITKLNYFTIPKRLSRVYEVKVLAVLQETDKIV